MPRRIKRNNGITYSHGGRTDGEEADLEGLHDAAAKGDLARVQRMLAQGAKVNGRDGDVAFQRTPLMWSAIYGRLQVIQLLINNGANVNATDPDGETALSLAEKFGKRETARILIQAGARRKRQG